MEVETPERLERGPTQNTPPQTLLTCHVVCIVCDHVQVVKFEKSRYYGSVVCTWAVGRNRQFVCPSWRFVQSYKSRDEPQGDHISRIGVAGLVKRTPRRTGLASGRYGTRVIHPIFGLLILSGSYEGLHRVRVRSNKT